MRAPAKGRRARAGDGERGRRAGRGQGVCVNLRFDTAEARALGVENHVCELQLLLADLVDPDVRPRRRGGDDTGSPLESAPRSRPAHSPIPLAPT